MGHVVRSCTAELDDSERKSGHLKTRMVALEAELQLARTRMADLEELERRIPVLEQELLHARSYISDVNEMQQKNVQMGIQVLSLQEELIATRATSNLVVRVCACHMSEK